MTAQLKVMDRSSTGQLRDALDAADPVLLVMILVHFTGDEALLDEFRPYIKKVKEQARGDIPVDKLSMVKARLFDLLSRGESPKTSHPDLLRRMIETAVGEPIPDDYVPMLLDASGLAPRREPAPLNTPGFQAVIVGAGPSGIAAAVYLQKAGIPFVIVEQSAEPGGSWNDNRYPGCGVDTASHFYSYSFAPNLDWPRYFSLQPQIKKYINDCVERFGLRPHMRMNTSVREVRFDDATKRWSIDIRDAQGREETLHANAVVSAVGQLSQPFYPKIEGIETFGGEVVHTARWPKDLDYKGKRVALIGAGSSGLQVGPTIAPEVKRLTVFQRSAQWLASRVDYQGEISDAVRWAFHHIPNYAFWHRLRLIWMFGDTVWPALYVDAKPAEGVKVSRANDELRAQWTAYIEDRLKGRPDLIARVMPSYPPLTKRPPVDNGWFEMLQRDNVDLVTSEIDHVEPGKIVARDGSAHDADIIVLATGFQASRMLQTISVKGRDGRDLRSLWGEDDPRAFLGVTVPGFPNFFIMYGPNTNLGHGGNIIFHGECQANYIVSCLRHLASTKSSAMEVTQAAFDRYTKQIDERIARTVWSTPGISSWFKNSQGRVTTNSPWRIAEYWHMTRQVEPNDYRLT